jgi:putative component of toxin-antitoxin plasmid stabilization module
MHRSKLFGRHLRDRVAQAVVMRRLDRLQSGNAGDCRSLGGGLAELRVLEHARRHRS